MPRQEASASCKSLQMFEIHYFLHDLLQNLFEQFLKRITVDLVGGEETFKNIALFLASIKFSNLEE